MSHAPAAASPPPATSLPITGEEGCTLYVGNLHPQVTEAMLHGVFQAAGTVCSIKIIINKKMPSSSHYGFVRFVNHEAAKRAMDTLNGHAVLDQAIKINWAFNNAFEHRDDTQRQYHIFVGDLTSDVDDHSLMQAFAQFPSLSNANIVRDIETTKSRGYGFVVFGDKADAYSAIHTMNGYHLGSRPIRINWATHRTAGTCHSSQVQSSLSFDAVAAQTPPYNTTVYVGNLPHQTTPEQVVGLFQAYGYIVSTHFQFARGYAFVKLGTHEHAAHAITALHGFVFNGRPLRCSWGKDRVPAVGPAMGMGMGHTPAYGYPPPPMGLSMSRYAATYSYPRHFGNGINIAPYSSGYGMSPRALPTWPFPPGHGGPASGGSDEPVPHYAAYYDYAGASGPSGGDAMSSLNNPATMASGASVHSAHHYQPVQGHPQYPLHQ